MSDVRIYNENTHTYKENFRGEEIVIEPGKFVTMDEKKAVMFLGTYSPIKKTAMGTPDPKYFKKLVIKKDVAAAAASEPQKWVCHFDATEHESKEALEKYINENHLDKISDQKFAEERRKGKK